MAAGNQIKCQPKQYKISSWSKRLLDQAVKSKKNVIRLNINKKKSLKTETRVTLSKEYMYKDKTIHTIA